jgi:anti-sigma B factor antagonist
MTSPRFNPADYVTVTVTSLQAVTVIKVAGEIDMATRDAMADPLFAQVDDAPSGLVLDLTDIEFMGSAGLAVLIEAYKRTRQGGTSLGIVVAAESPVQRSLEISGLLELLPVYRRMADALCGVAGGSSQSPAADRPAGHSMTT